VLVPVLVLVTLLRGGCLLLGDTIWVGLTTLVIQLQ